jgi:hypothetical protein
MHLYLNPPRAFWQLPDTNIKLMRTSPLMEVSEVELSQLSPEQKTILSKSLDSGVLVSISPDSPLLLSGNGTLDILSLSAAEIQRKHISRMILKGKKGLAELNDLLAKEKAKTSPREDVLTVIKYGIERIHAEDPETLEDKFYREIEVIEDVIEQDVPQAEAPKKKTRTRAGKLTNAETN